MQLTKNLTKMLSIINGSNQKVPNIITLEQELLVEKKNLINIFKLVIKDLIDSTSIKLNNNKCVETSQSYELFFDVFENILNHGFKGKKSFNYFQKKDYSCLLDIIELKYDHQNKNLKSIKDITEIKTSLGRVRAWLRILLMQKQLSETITQLIQEKDALSEIYEPEAILLSDEANIICGLLIGLNGLDFSIDLKSILDVLDQPIHLIKYSNYLRERIPSEFDEIAHDDLNENKINEIFNQKNYIEEMNKKQEVQLDFLTKRLTEIEQSNSDLRDEVVAFRLENTDLKSKLDSIELDRTQLEEEYKLKYDALNNDIKTERETFLSSKTGLDSMYIELQKKILDETKQRTNLENELTVQQTMKNELETALKLMDHSLIDKQDIIHRLRDQLDMVKSLNLELNQTCNTMKQENDQNKVKLNTFLKENEELKTSLNEKQSILLDKIDLFNKQSETIIFYEQKSQNLESNLAIEKNWRMELQTNQDAQNGLISTLNEKLVHLKEIQTKFEHLKHENSNLKQINSDLEKTLEEMGSKLGTSHLKIDDFKEVSKHVNDFQWEQDEKVTNCKLCVKDFNVARRKHHCRRCGGIFCNECSVSTFLLYELIINK